MRIALHALGALVASAILVGCNQTAEETGTAGPQTDKSQQTPLASTAEVDVAAAPGESMATDAGAAKQVVSQQLPSAPPALGRPAETAARETAAPAPAAGAVRGRGLRARYANPIIPNRNNRHFDTETYDHLPANDFIAVTQQPLSTFSIDVDTASYSNVRRFLTHGNLPPAGAVRIEELINYFSYNYEPPVEGAGPLAVRVELAECPWNAEHSLARIALKAYEVDFADRPPVNLVFLLDVSGSMNRPNKLPYVQESMRMLVDKLGENDQVTIVVYRGAEGLVLPTTTADHREVILEAIGRLRAGGSTNGGAGIKLAYHKAVENFIPGGVNRVILCTDGDFNVGVTSQSELVNLIEDKADSGVFLSVLGYGTGNYKASTMEKLADKGNGNYAYIDTLSEARKVLVEEVTGTLITIAKDVKIQVDFNPAQVAAYRLIGYENRMLEAQDFTDDTKDAGEVGAGHSVTAFYELVPPGAPNPAEEVEPSKYQTPSQPNETANSNEVFTVRLRYKLPDAKKSQLVKIPVERQEQPFDETSQSFRFAAAVAQFGMLLRKSEYAPNANWTNTLQIASTGVGADEHGYRAEFVDLVRQAAELSGEEMPKRETALRH